MKHFPIVFFFLLIPLGAHPQADTTFQPSNPPIFQSSNPPTFPPSTLRDLAFANYLSGRGEHTDAVFFLQNMIPGREETGFRDTLNSLLGWSYYNLKSLDSSTACYLQVSPNSASYLKARFFSAYNLVFSGKRMEARDILATNSLFPPNGHSLLPEEAALFREFRSFELAGLALLDRDLKLYDSLSGQFTYSYYPFAKEEKKMEVHARTLESFRQRSPAVAGILSALVPGSGKIYAGKKAEGIASFLVVGALGLVTWENYRKDGLTDYKTLFFGAIGSAYYLGNILGSMAAAKRYNSEFHHEIDNRILFDLHIPLRNLFN